MWVRGLLMSRMVGVFGDLEVIFVLPDGMGKGEIAAIEQRVCNGRGTDPSIREYSVGWRR